MKVKDKTRQNEHFIFYWETNKNPITGWRVAPESEVEKNKRQKQKRYESNR